jgi:sphingomyelin phosphodiesterase
MKLSHALVGLLWVSVARATIVDDVLEAIKNAVSCTSCHALLVPLKSLAVLGDGPFEDTIIAICKATKVRHTLYLL